MRLEIWIWIISWIVTPLALYVLIPRAKIWEANIVFWFAQFLTWSIDILNVQLNLVQFPYREFDYATQTSFTMHYMVYPGMFVFFALYDPERRSWPVRLVYWLLWTLGITLFVYGLDWTTELMKIVNRNFLLRFSITLALLLLTRLFYVWYRKGFRSAEDATDSAA